MITARPLAVTAIGFAHAAMLGAIVFGGVRGPALAASAKAMTVRAVPSPPIAETVPTLTFAAIDVAVAPPEVEIADDASTGDCELLGTIAIALARDPAVSKALAQSSANRTAMMVWDGRWASDIAPIRRVIVAQVAAASMACSSATVIGPRLLIVPTGSTTVAIALGSGTWTWSALL